MYQIYTADDLKEFAVIVNGTDSIPADSDADARLMNDIDLKDVCGENVGESGQSVSWAPIGSDSSRYSGTFNGDGHTISGLYINNSRADYQGLFGYVGTGGTVKDLSVSGSVSGHLYVGGIAGQNGGNVINCTFSGSVSGVSTVGGVVGWNNGGTVENCTNTGSVTGANDYVGGVVGYNGSNSTVENCYNTGTVSSNSNISDVGGVVGYNHGGRVENCYNTGEVSGKISVGGVVGLNDSGIVENCYNTGKVIGSSVGGVVGLNNSTVTGCYFLKTDGVPANGIGSGSGDTTSVTTLDALCDALKGDTDTWTISDTLNRPVLKDNHEDDGSEDHPYEIFTATQLENFRDLVNGENGNPAAWAVLMENIDLEGSEAKPWTPIGTRFSNSYSGNFDGNGKTISGLYIVSSDNNQGLFGYLSGTGTVQNLSVSGSVSVSHGEDVGGVVGYNRGSVENCYNTGEVSGNRYVGGVVGDNYGGRVENCYNTGTVSDPDSGTGNRVGGVVGWNISSVTNCYNTGSVSGNQVGGVVGYNSGSVTNCYFLQTDDVNAGLSGFGENYGSCTVTEKDAAAFHSGEVAHLLGEAWGQSALGTDNSWPTLVALDNSAKTVYKVTVDYNYDGAQNKTTYTNDPAKPAAPAREGYTFDHWDKTEGEGNTITYTAQWTPHTYSITASPSALDFGSITEGEERPAAQNVTITNTGNQTVTLNPPAAENFEIGTLSAKELKPDESATFTIQPKDKLPRGSYSEQIAISNTNDEEVIITATFTVKEPPYTGKYSYELTTSVGDHGSLTVDRYATEGDKVTIDVTPDQAYKLDELVVTANGKDVELTANSDGTYTFTMPSADVKITATFAEDPDWTEPEEPTTDVSDLFIDVAPDAWYKDAVQYAYDNGLMTGVSATEFAPEATTTRAMIVSILARLEGVESAQAAGFADVNDNDWYATAVNWAASVGVVNGYEDNTFKPNTAITREQLAAILMNYAAYKGEDVSNRASLATYTDQPSTWAEEAMSWAVAKGLISGVTNTELQPQGNATRAQVAAILQRYLEA